MKTTRRGVILIVVIGLTFGLKWHLTAQSQNVLEFISAGQADGLFQPAEKTIPVVSSSTTGPLGTYWTLQTPRAPLPGNYFPELTVYEIDATNHVYLIDDRSVDYAALKQWIATEQMSSQGEGEFMLLSEEGGGGGAGMFSMMYSSDDLWLEMTGLTLSNRTGNFVIYPPESETNGVFDLYVTTNLTSTVPGLNSTNWQWVLRCDPGQTNLVVTNLAAAQAFFRLGRTNDTDDDLLSDAFERLVSHTDPNNGDQNTNQIPDGWEWIYFGDLSQTATNDYDGDGVNNWQEYTNHTDPNTVICSVSSTNLYVNNNSAWVRLRLRGGVPASIAVVVDSTNLVDAHWAAYSSSNVLVNLGSTDGWHKVRVGLRGRPTTSQQVWQSLRLKLDTTLPVLAITNPVATPISQPWIQLQGYSSEALRKISYDLTNAAGWITNQTAFVVSQQHDTNLWEFTTNYFQAFDLDLTNGVNVITLRAADLAGNVTTTNFSFTVDYSGDTNPPAIQLRWPQEGMRISASNLTWRGFVDDSTATITVTATGTNGVTNSATAIVEREGVFWVRNVPLTEGTNLLTLTATDAAGNPTSTNIAVINEPSALTIDAVPENALPNGGALVYGTIGLSDHTVWVNGQRATQTNGTWVADAPFPPGGTVLIQAVAIPNSDNGGNGSGGVAGQNPVSASSIPTEWEADRPSFVYLASYKARVHGKDSVDYDGFTGGALLDIQTEFHHPMESDNYGQGSYYRSVWMDNYPDEGGVGETTSWDYVWPRDMGYKTLNRRYEYWNQYIDPPDFTNVWSEIGGGLNGVFPFPYGFDHGMCATLWQEESSDGEFDEYTRLITSELHLWTGGKSAHNRRSLFRLSASVRQWSYYYVPDPLEPQKLYAYMDYEDLSLPPPPGIHPVLPDGITVSMMPQAQSQTLNADGSRDKYNLKIKANNHELSPNIVVTNAKYCVGQNIGFVASWETEPADVQSQTFKWAFDGNFKNAQTNAVPNCSDCSMVPHVNSMLLTNVATTNWWVSGNFDPPATYEANLEATIVFTDGEVRAYTATGKFSMAKPLSKITTKTGEVSINSTWGDLLMSFGENGPNGVRGIVFSNSITMPPGFSGVRKWMQVVTNEFATRQRAGDLKYERHRAAGLDTGDPYSLNNPTDDSPGIRLTNGYVEINQLAHNFVMWILFQPDGDSHWVPLRAVAWSWSGSATNGGGGWTLQPGTVQHSVDPEDFSTEVYPYWTDNITNQITWELLN